MNASPDIILWIHDGSVVDSRVSSSATHWDLWDTIPDGRGRIDIMKRVGSMVINPDVGRKKARRVAEDTIKAFPGVKFRVFYISDIGDSHGMSMQEFWESTE